MKVTDFNRWFNKMFDKYQVKNESDEGYGDWMKQNEALETEQGKLFQNGFNKDMFNATFEQYKQQQSQKMSY